MPLDVGAGEASHRGDRRALPASLRVDQGGGLLDLVAADRVLRRLPVGASVRLAVGGVPGAGVYRILDPNRPATDTTVMVEILGSLGGPVRLTSNTAWVEPPGQVQLTPPQTSVPIGLRGSALRDPGVFGARARGTIQPGGTQRVFFPLGQLLVEVNGSGWGREVRLPEPLPPIMR